MGYFSIGSFILHIVQIEVKKNLISFCLNQRMDKKESPYLINRNHYDIVNKNYAKQNLRNEGGDYIGI